MIVVVTGLLLVVGHSHKRHRFVVNKIEQHFFSYFSHYTAKTTKRGFITSLLLKTSSSGNRKL